MSDSDDPYTYPGSDVLKNKRDIRDAAALQKFELEKSSFRSFELLQRPIPGEFDLKHLNAIHKHLFQDVYEWAGKPRTVFIQKGDSMFGHPAFIESAWAAEHKKLQALSFLRGMEKDKFTTELARHYGEVNAIHPYREGNGRSTRQYLYQLAKEASYELDYSKVSKARWNEAAKLSFMSSLTPMQQVFSTIATHTKVIAFDQDKPEVAIAKHPSLKSAFLTLKAAEIYAGRVISDQASRDSFMLKTREQVRETLAAGKDLPDPQTKGQDRGLSR